MIGDTSRSQRLPGDLLAVMQAQTAGVPFLLLRDCDGHQLIHPLDPSENVIVVGRRASCDLALTWDSLVLRQHVQWERVGDDWSVIDDGLSGNGTTINGERLEGRKRLSDGDIVLVGATPITLRSPTDVWTAETLAATHEQLMPEPSEAQRRVLVTLCRPFKGGSTFATPQSNPDIAAELFLSVEAINSHLKVIFSKFGVAELQPGQKRARFVELALTTGLINKREL